MVSVETEAWSSTRLQDASLPLFSPSSIYPLHLAARQTALCHRPSLQTLIFSIFILPSCASVSLSLSYSSLSHPSPFLSLSVAPLISPCPLRKECLKIEAAEKRKVMDTWRHSPGNLRGRNRRMEDREKKGFPLKDGCRVGWCSDDVVHAAGTSHSHRDKHTPVWLSRELWIKFWCQKR